jgi:hypothetical protein
MYTYTWKKYLPVIRILLKRSVTAEQKMDLNRIDFERGSRNRKISVHFSIELIKGRLSTSTLSVPAKNLVTVLLEDDVTRVLVRQNQYEIALGSDFKLSIKNTTPPAQEEEISQGDTAASGDEPD